jgi:diguanylate cyclase (GGDEF)-like protein/PAS domain S-box-containing protein
VRDDVSRNIGILIQHIDGFYFGDIIWGIAQEAASLSVNLMAIETGMHDKDGKRKPYTARIAWEQVDVWIVVGDAVELAYMEQLAGLGKPIVTVSNRFEGVPSSVVICDNRGGAYQSTKHLIDLGHRRLAFVGNLTNLDFYERYEGYKEALADAGISFDETIVYNVGWGESGALRMLADKLPFTAVVAAADFLIPDMIHHFQQAGVSIPSDIAVVGYDDSGTARKSTPSITSVRQPVNDLGAAAMRRAAELLDNPDAEPTIQTLEARIIVRESSGSGYVDPEGFVNDQLLNWSLQDDELEQYIEAHYQLSLAVLEHTSFEWLRFTNQHWGCVGLYNTVLTDQDRFLIVDRVFSSKQDPLPDIGDRFEEERFPIVPPMRCSADHVDLMVIQNVHSELHIWGFVATIGPINKRLLLSYDIRQLPALIGTINERRVLLTELQQREAHNAALVEKLEIVSRTSNDGVFELNIVTGSMQWIISSIEHILNRTAEELPATNAEFEQLIHPEDQARYAKAWKSHYFEGHKFEVEYRIRSRNEYRWVLSTGEILRGTAGSATRFIGSITDIHSRKQAEEAVLESGRKYRDFFLNTPVMILSLNDRYEIMDANPYWLKEMEYEDTDVIGRRCDEFLTAQSQEHWLRYWHEHANDADAMADLELQWVTKYGKIIDGLVNSQSYNDAGQRLTYLTVRNITERKRAEKQIHHIAYHDELTGLPNRRYFYEELGSLVVKKEHSARAALMVVDVDHFKSVNDTYGHNAGDKLLQYVAHILLDVVAQQGLAARIGGDEFMVLLQHKQEEDVDRIAEEIIRRLKVPMPYGDHSIQAAVSIGVGMYPSHGSDIETLIKTADTAMYQAKKTGRNRWS